MELKRQSSEKFLRVAGVSLVHTLGGPGRYEDFSPRLYFTVPLRCILGGPHPTLGVDSEGSAVFRDTVFEAFRRLAPFSLPPDHFASHDDVGEAIVVHARDAAGVVEDALHHSGLNALTVDIICLAKSVDRICREYNSVISQMRLTLLVGKF